MTDTDTKIRNFFKEKDVYEPAEVLTQEEIEESGEQSFDKFYLFWLDTPKGFKIDAYIEEMWASLRYFLTITVYHQEIAVLQGGISVNFFVDEKNGLKSIKGLWDYTNEVYKLLAITENIELSMKFKDEKASQNQIKRTLKDFVEALFKKCRIIKYEIV